MRFHLAGLPHTNTTAEFAACGFTEKVRKLSAILKGLGHTVFLYGGTENEAVCDEFISCMRDEERVDALGGRHFTEASFDVGTSSWRRFDHRVANAVRKRAESRDILLLPAGSAHKPIADALPALMAVEPGIGYVGSFARYRVFESYAWMHATYGAQSAALDAFDPPWFDEVIPGFFDPDDFPFSEEKDDYFLFLGRLTPRKGAAIAADVCKALGARLITVGRGPAPAYGEHIEFVSTEERGRLLSRARAVFCPTQYLEPFGNVAVEAMLCGTPVIASDFGGFTDTVVEGKTGFRCRSFAEFVAAAEAVGELSPARIRELALLKHSTAAAARLYGAYFERLETLWGDGWYAQRSPSGG